jgi:membrane carboxypeptidase/penicillin-binding protein
VIWSREPVVKRALAPAVAYLVTSMLSDVIDRGTGTAVRAEGFTGVAAGKTGTTDDAADVWFVGYTPETVGTIWMGFDRPQTVLAGATGGELAAPVWGRVMRRVAEGSRGWSMPEGVVKRLVDGSGRVFGEHCPVMPGTRFEYFLGGVSTVTSCNSDPMYTDTDSLGQYPADSIFYRTGWRARLGRRPFSLDTVAVGTPAIAVAPDSVPR